MAIYKPILATLGYVMSQDQTSVLLIHRNMRPDDMHYGKYNGLGGKLDAHEDVFSGMRRELFEEAGIVADDQVLRGIVSWPGFGRDPDGWFAFVFRIDQWHGIPRTQNEEGTLIWVRLEDLPSINLWESDRPWLNLVFADTPSMFHGVAIFDGNRLASWTCTMIESMVSQHLKTEPNSVASLDPILLSSTGV